MSGKKDKEKRFENRLDNIIKEVKRIDVKEGEVLLIELDPKISPQGFATLSRSFRAAFDPKRVQIIFGPQGPIKNITAVGGKALKRVVTDEKITAAKQEVIAAAQEEKSKESFEDWRQKIGEGGK